MGMRREREGNQYERETWIGISTGCLLGVELPT